MTLLTQFLLRLTFGLALGMAITSPRQVTSGFFRNHLYVTLGLATLAAMVGYTMAPGPFWWAVAAAVVSYVGSVCWLYESKGLGRAALLVVALCSLQGTFAHWPLIDSSESPGFMNKYFPTVEGQLSAAEVATMERRTRIMGYTSGALSIVSNVTSGLLLGMTTTAMLLGHWYLNSPTMELAPLRRLLVAMGIAVAIQSFVSAIGLASELRYAHGLTTAWLLFVLLRWCFGLIGVAALTWMAWQTLKTPNTQSATGILYVAVIGVFVGELTGLLLSAESAFPL